MSGYRDWFPIQIPSVSQILQRLNKSFGNKSWQKWCEYKEAPAKLMWQVPWWTFRTPTFDNVHNFGQNVMKAHICERETNTWENISPIINAWHIFQQFGQHIIAQLENSMFPSVRIVCLAISKARWKAGSDSQGNFVAGWGLAWGGGRGRGWAGKGEKGF